MEKKFAKSASEMRPVAVGYGGCMVSDRIMVDGKRVGYMYRDEPHDEYDSGWCFFAGDESEEYAADPANFAIYDVNTAANYDPDITEHLEAEPPCAFERVGGIGKLVAAPHPDEED